VERLRFDTLDGALDAAESRARSIAGTAPRTAVDARFRRFEPIEQVAARIELAGPERLIGTVSAGLDIRGDGSTEAYVGRLRRELVKQRKGETPYVALRRTLAARTAKATRSAKSQA